MELIIGKTAGFCYGVNNAVEKSIDELKKGKKLCCLGEIVHNKAVIEELKESGLIFIDNIEENKYKYKTIIRAHGIKKEIYDIAKKNNIEILDLTCPNVLKIHEIVEKHTKDGYYIMLIGSKEHPETIGTASFCGKYFSVLEDEIDIDESINLFKKSEKGKILLVVQTTFSLEKFNTIVDIIKKRLDKKVDLKIVNTICMATKERQEETEAISKKVDVMIIIGGKNSSNTKKLYEVSQKNCKNTICIENYTEINMSKIIEKNVIGVMAGASTPKNSI